MKNRLGPQLRGSVVAKCDGKQQVHREKGSLSNEIFSVGETTTGADRPM